MVQEITTHSIAKNFSIGLNDDGKKIRMKIQGAFFDKKSFLRLLEIVAL